MCFVDAVVLLGSSNADLHKPPIIRVRTGTSESHVMALKLKRLQVREELLPLVKSSNISCSQVGEQVSVRWTGSSSAVIWTLFW